MERASMKAVNRSGYGTKGAEKKAEPGKMSMKGNMKKSAPKKEMKRKKM